MKPTYYMPATRDYMPATRDYMPATRDFEPINHAPPERGVPDCLEPDCHRPVTRDGLCSRHITLEGL